MLKNKALGFYYSCAGAALGIAAMVLYLFNISNAYFADSVSAAVVVCSVLAALMLLAYIALAKTGRKKKEVEFLRGLMPAAATFCFFAALMSFLGTRVYSMAIIYGSSLEANNTAAQSAMAQAVTALVLYLMAGIAAIAAAYSKIEKEE